MDLKDRFNNYQTEVDPEAWAHFQLLRRNKKPKRRFFWWFFTGGGLLVLLGGIAFWQWQQPTISSQNKELTTTISAIDTTSSIDNSLTKIKKPAAFPIATEVNANKETIINSVINIDEKSVNNTTIKPKSTLFSATTVMPKEVEKVNANSTLNSQKTIATNIDLQEKARKIQLSEEKPLVDSVSFQPKNTFDSIQLALIESPLISLLSIPDTVEAIILPITKPLKRKKNTVKLSLGHANAFINGFSTENPVDKRGFSIQAVYYHEWNKIIGTGISAGYLKTIDQENPSFQIKDQEIIKYIHADLYLFLYNEQKHKLYAKIGAGLTNTDRILAGFFIPLNGPVERVFQINNLTNIGYSVEGAYEYQLKNSFSIGANFGIISHNDGGWFTGLSIGYHF